MASSSSSSIPPNETRLQRETRLCNNSKLISNISIEIGKLYPQQWGNKKIPPALIRKIIGKWLGSKTWQDFDTSGVKDYLMKGNSAIKQQNQSLTSSVAVSAANSEASVLILGLFSKIKDRIEEVENLDMNQNKDGNNDKNKIDEPKLDQLTGTKKVGANPSAAPLVTSFGSVGSTGLNTNPNNPNSNDLQSLLKMSNAGNFPLQQEARREEEERLKKQRDEERLVRVKERKEQEEINQKNEKNQNKQGQNMDDINDDLNKDEDQFGGLQIKPRQKTQAEKIMAQFLTGNNNSSSRYNQNNDYDMETNVSTTIGTNSNVSGSTSNSMCGDPLAALINLNNAGGGQGGSNTNVRAFQGTGRMMAMPESKMGSWAEMQKLSQGKGGSSNNQYNSSSQQTWNSNSNHNDFMHNSIYQPGVKTTDYNENNSNSNSGYENLQRLILDEKEEEEYQKKIQDLAEEALLDEDDERAIERDWYEMESGSGSGLGGGSQIYGKQLTNEELFEKEEKAKKLAMEVYQKNSNLTVMMSNKAAKQVERQFANDQWENQLMRHADLSGGNKRTFDLDAIERQGLETQSREHVIVSEIVPPFLDGRIVYTTQSEAVSVVREPTGDMATIAKKGCASLKSIREDNDKNKMKERWWELSGSKMGEVIGVKQMKEEGGEGEEGDTGDNKEGEEGEKNAANGGPDNTNNDPTTTTSSIHKNADNDDDDSPGHQDYKKSNQFAQSMRDANNPKNIAQSDFAKNNTIPEVRRMLPVFGVRDEFLMVLRECNCIIVVGETGSGKTTQLAQYLWEEGYASESGRKSQQQDGENREDLRLIGCTQPRRMAAMSVAQRVSEERKAEYEEQLKDKKQIERIKKGPTFTNNEKEDNLNDNDVITLSKEEQELNDIGGLVGYSIRFEDVTSDLTRIKFMTDGILLRESLEDPLLEKYSCIIIDEAHERSLNTDVLLGLLKRVLEQRTYDFKLIVTSATMDAERFSRFFGGGGFDANAISSTGGGVPIFHIPGRTFPVDTFFVKSPIEDYISSAVQQALEIHVTQERGDILIFCTGQEDIEACCILLADRLESVATEAENKESNQGKGLEPLSILPVYSIMPADLQTRIFQPSKYRKCICATNIAETSLTIEGVRYVIDCGYSKVKTFDSRTGMDRLEICPISQANANQRRGRAGRTESGMCWRLYTERAFVSEMWEMAIPEIQRTNLSQVVLLLKSLGVDNLLDFEWLSPPSQDTIISSMFQLWTLNALDNLGKLTRIGKKMSQFPVDPALAKMILIAADQCLETLDDKNDADNETGDNLIGESDNTKLRKKKINTNNNNKRFGRGNADEDDYIDTSINPNLDVDLIGTQGSEKFGCLQEILIIIAMLTIPNIFYRPRGREQEADSKREHFSVAESDHLTLLNVYLQYKRQNYSSSWCTSHYIHHKSMKKVRETYNQLVDLITNKQGIVLSSVGLGTSGAGSGGGSAWDVVRKAICSGYFTNAARMRAIGEYINLRTNVPCHLHPTSALYGLGFCPDYLVYHEVTLTTKTYMSNVTVVEPSWLAELGPMFFTLRGGQNSSGTGEESRRAEQARKRQMEYEHKMHEDRIAYEKKLEQEKRKKVNEQKAQESFSVFGRRQRQGGVAGGGLLSQVMKIEEIQQQNNSGGKSSNIDQQQSISYDHNSTSSMTNLSFLDIDATNGKKTQSSGTSIHHGIGGVNRTKIVSSGNKNNDDDDDDAFGASKRRINTGVMGPPRKRKMMIVGSNSNTNKASESAAAALSPAESDGDASSVKSKDDSVKSAANRFKRPTIKPSRNANAKKCLVDESDSEDD